MTRKFTKTLEEKANQLAAYPFKDRWDDSVPSMLRREIALTVEQIQRLRDRHDEQFHRLLKVECYVDTELMQMEARQPQYVPYHFPEKDKLRQRLFDIEKERRNLSLRLEEKTQSLEERLLSLINRHQQLDI
jgi:ATP-dependent RNA circularization protein (DNA/RNA ligase family)